MPAEWGLDHSRQGTVLWISGTVALCPKLALAASRNQALPTGEGVGSLSAWDFLSFDLDKEMGWTTMMGRQSAYFHKVAGYCSCISMSPRMTYLFDIYAYARAMGPLGAASWSQTLMWRSWVRRPLCTVLIISIGIFWRRSSEGT